MERLDSILMAAPDSDPRRLAALLAWQAAAGADEAILEHPVDRYRTEPPAEPRPRLSEAPAPMPGFAGPKPSLAAPAASRPVAARPAAGSPVIAGARELAAAARSL